MTYGCFYQVTKQNEKIICKLILILGYFSDNSMSFIQVNSSRLGHMGVLVKKAKRTCRNLILFSFLFLGYAYPMIVMILSRLPPQTIHSSLLFILHEIHFTMDFLGCQYEVGKCALSISHAVVEKPYTDLRIIYHAYWLIGMLKAYWRFY